MKFRRREFLTGAVAAAVLPQAVGDEWGDLANIWDGRAWMVGFGDDGAGYRKVERAALVDERAKHPVTQAQLKWLIRLWVDAQG